MLQFSPTGGIKEFAQFNNALVKLSKMAPFFGYFVVIV